MHVLLPKSIYVTNQNCCFDVLTENLIKYVAVVKILNQFGQIVENGIVSGFTMIIIKPITQFKLHFNKMNAFEKYAQLHPVNKTRGPFHY